MIHEEICTYEVAKLAKEKGFPQDPNKNGHCEMYCWDGLRNTHSLGTFVVWYMEEYNRDNLYAAPTQSLLQRWLREDKGIHINIDRDLDFNEKDYIYEWQASHKKELGDGCYRIITASDMEFYPTYEETLNAALKYALENLV